ncbi:hypothetical protein A6R68_23442, partial [Neotoma lepida]
HPVLDEPIAEAVCIIADTDKWTVQVATSQRKVMDTMKLGQDVLVSNQNTVTTYMPIIPDSVMRMLLPHNINGYNAMYFENVYTLRFSSPASFRDWKLAILRRCSAQWKAKSNLVIDVPDDVKELAVVASRSPWANLVFVCPR